MALTQQRLLELLKEGESFAQEYETLFKDIRAILSSPQGDSERIARLIQRVNIVPKPRVLLVIERARYNMTHSRNEYLRRKKASGRELGRVMKERPGDYIEPEDKVDELFARIDRGRADETATLAAPSVNPPKPAAWQRPEPQRESSVAIHEAAELARVADEMEARRIRQEELDKEAMK